MSETIETDRRCAIVKNVFDRWILVNVYAPKLLAWSGSKWVQHNDGLPSGGFQVCNFYTKEEAARYADERGLIQE